MFESVSRAKDAPDHYHVNLQITLSGDLNIAALDRAWGNFLARHRVLRMSVLPFSMASGLAVISSEAKNPLRVVSTSGSVFERTQYLLALDAAEPFDIFNGPLIRAQITELSHARFLLLLSNHHLVLDGWSMPIMVDEVFKLYAEEVRILSNANSQRSTVTRLDAAFDWGSYLGWLQRQDRTISENYWKAYLESLESVSRVIFPTPTKNAKGIANAWLTLDQDTSESIKTFAQQQGLTQATVYQAGFALLLAELSRLDEVIIGSVRSGRSCNLPGIERAIGFFLSTLPQRFLIDPAARTVDWLHSYQLEHAEQEQYAHLGLARIQALAHGNAFVDKRQRNQSCNCIGSNSAGNIYQACFRN